MKKAFFYEKNGSLSVLTIDGKKVTKTQDIEVGGLPEAVVFTPDGNYILAGNYLTQDFSILKVDGTKVTDTGKRFLFQAIRPRRGWALGLLSQSLAVPFRSWKTMPPNHEPQYPGLILRRLQRSGISLTLPPLHPH